jgi:hypothetical protein
VSITGLDPQLCAQNRTSLAARVPGQQYPQETLNGGESTRHVLVVTLESDGGSVPDGESGPVSGCVVAVGNLRQ